MNVSSSKNSPFSGKTLILSLSFVPVICGVLSLWMASVFMRSASPLIYYLSSLVMVFPRFGIFDIYQYVGPFFCSLMLVGCILFMTDRKKVHLIRFVASLMLLSHILRVILMVNYDFRLLTHQLAGTPFGPRWPLYIIIALWLLLDVVLLVEIQRFRKLAVREIIADSGEEVREFVNSSQGIRFLHYLIDLIVSWTFFFYAKAIMELLFMREVGRIFGEQFSLSLYFIFFRIVYYLFFETVWQATPAKMLTGTRVTDFHGEKISFQQALSRSFSRMVPFEPFSFLIRTGGGWHDKWSETFVLRETDITTDAPADAPLTALSSGYNFSSLTGGQSGSSPSLYN